MKILETPRHLQWSLQRMRISGDMCDIKVVSKQGTKYPAHSLALAAVSPIFKIMVTKDFKELNSKEIQLPDIDDTILKLILDFVYTGEMEITNENVMDLFMITARLDIDALFLCCVEYIKQNVEMSNCLEILRIADRYDQKDLHYHTTIFILRHFQQFAGTEYYLDLTVGELTLLLLRDELDVEKEEYLIDFILRWVDHDIINRGHELENLMKCLRYSVMNFYFIEGKFQGHPRWKDNKTIQQLVSSIYKGCSKVFQRISTDPDPNLKCLKVKPRVPSQVIYLFGGWTRGRTLDSTECYNIKTGKWNRAHHLRDDTERRSYYGIECVKGEIYLIGGYNGRSYLNTSRCFNPVNKTWSCIPPMHYRRCFTSAVTLGDDLYVIAGFDGKRRLASVEKYSTVSKQWIVMKPLSTPRSDAAAVVHNDQIYIFGGYLGNSVDTGEIYDAETDTWHHIMNMNTRRSGASAVSLPVENKILVLGGCNGDTRLATTEYYDPITNTWSDGPPMAQERSNFGTCVIGGRVFVIGGYTGKITLKDVEVLDLHTRTWQFAQPIKDGRSAMRAIVLENVSDPEYYFQTNKRATKFYRHHTDQPYVRNAMAAELNNGQQ